MSGTTQIVRVPTGGAVTVRTGLLRGAGPQGPMGPQGPAGPPGSTGLQGPPGVIQSLVTRLSSTASVATSYDRWYPAAMDTVDENQLLVPSTDGLNLQFASAITALMVLVAQFDTTHSPMDGGVASGARQLRIVDGAGNILDNAYVSVNAAANEPTVVMLIAVVEPDPSRFYHLEAQSRDDIGVNLTARHVTFIQIGAGPPGPQGPTGPVGSTGPQGAAGTAGSAGSGYALYNALAPGSPDTTMAPGGVAYASTVDQGLRTPLGTQLPFTPYFMSRLALDIEPLVVARYASAADRTTKRAARSPGEVTYLGDSGALQFRELVGGADNNIARVVVSSATPPSGSGQAAPGVIWIQT